MMSKNNFHFLLPLGSSLQTDSSDWTPFTGDGYFSGQRYFSLRISRIYGLSKRIWPYFRIFRNAIGCQVARKELLVCLTVQKKRIADSRMSVNVLTGQVLDKLLNFKHLQTRFLFEFFTKDTPHYHEKEQFVNRHFRKLYRRHDCLYKQHGWLYERQKKVSKKTGTEPGLNKVLSYGHKNEIVGCPVTSVEQFSFFFVCFAALKVNTLLLFNDTFFMI